MTCCLLVASPVLGEHEGCKGCWWSSSAAKTACCSAQRAYQLLRRCVSVLDVSVDVYYMWACTTEQEEVSDDDPGDQPTQRVRRATRGSQGSRSSGVANPTSDSDSGTTPLPDLRAQSRASGAASQAASPPGFRQAQEGDHSFSERKRREFKQRQGVWSERGVSESSLSGERTMLADGSVNDGGNGSEVASQNAFCFFFGGVGGPRIR